MPRCVGAPGALPSASAATPAIAPVAAAFLGQERHQLAYRRGVSAAVDRVADALELHQTSASKDREMLRQRALAKTARLRQRTGPQRFRPRGEQVPDHSQPARLAERRQDGDGGRGIHFSISAYTEIEPQ
jgi:hypothetical protein